MKEIWVSIYLSAIGPEKNNWMKAPCFNSGVGIFTHGIC